MASAVSLSVRSCDVSIHTAIGTAPTHAGGASPVPLENTLFCNSCISRDVDRHTALKYLGHDLERDELTVQLISLKMCQPDDKKCGTSISKNVPGY